jgi:alkanesulfonate monooxygenase SsuD/methylene tetrahydromethanopterin reductase-like flavin-dependent oxidoreductase (luciferase family)
MAGPFSLGLDVLTYGASWADALATVRLADRLGYDAVYTADHLFATGGDPFQPFFEGWTTLAAWSQQTTNVHLGLLVGANTFRNPGVVAKMTTTLDHASGGRAILGLGAGWEVEEQIAHGIDAGSSLGERLDWLDESLVQIRGVLHGDAETFEEGHYRFRGVRQRPLPLQRHVPVLVGASGPRKGLRIVARHADLWQFWSPFDGADEFRRLDDVLVSHCGSLGRDPGEITRLAGAKVVIRPTRDAADREFERQLTVQPWSGEVLDYIATTGLWRTTAAQALDAIGVLQGAGAGGFIAQVYPPYDLETIEALATEVAPRLGWLPRTTPGGTVQ